MPRTAAFAHRNLPLLLLQAREALMQHRRPALRAHGLSDQQWRVLRVLREHVEDGLETGQLAERAYILGPSLTGMLARMERDGLVTRQRSAEDARRSLVWATDEGLTVADGLSNSIESQYEDLAAHLGPARLTQLYALLDELIALPPHALAEAAEEEESVR